jgi:predicted DNA-binding protein (UPF0251 family)
MSRQWRRRRGRRGRLPKPIRIDRTPNMQRFTPQPHSGGDPILINPAELEVLRLVDLEGYSQHEAGVNMEISRGTVWRLLQSARKKSAQALTESRPLHVTTPTAIDR